MRLEEKVLECSNEYRKDSIYFDGKINTPKIQFASVALCLKLANNFKNNGVFNSI